jgi:Family of unknown function (DUF5677)
MPTDVNFQIGDFKAQSEFREEHEGFIECLPTLNIALEKSFNRPAKDDIRLVDALIHDLSNEGVRRFSEIGLLCANGVGDGASIILRSMFEHLVTARYLHLHPEKAEDFVDYLYVHMHTVQSQMERTFGSDHISKEYKDLVEKNFDKVKERFSYTTRQGKRKTKSGWTDKSIVDMAINVGLSDFVVLAYYLPLEKAHPSAIHIIGEKSQKKESASQTLMISHKVLIELLILQHQHFGIEELRPLIAECLEDFEKIWKKYKQP